MVSLESIEKLARALEISVSALFSYAETPASGHGPVNPARDLVDILFIEDKPDDIELAMHALKSAGMANHIRVARDGEEALELLFGDGDKAGTREPSERPGGARPQIILLDLDLPKVDGLEVLRRLKTDPRTAAIPVIVLTASSRERDLQASKRLGAAAYIVKPLDFQNLTEVTSQLSLQWALLKPV